MSNNQQNDSTHVSDLYSSFREADNFIFSHHIIYTNIRKERFRGNRIFSIAEYCSFLKNLYIYKTFRFVTLLFIHFKTSVCKC